MEGKKGKKEAEEITLKIYKEFVEEYWLILLAIITVVIMIFAFRGV